MTAKRIYAFGKCFNIPKSVFASAELELLEVGELSVSNKHIIFTESTYKQRLFTSRAYFNNEEANRDLDFYRKIARDVVERRKVLHVVKS